MESFTIPRICRIGLSFGMNPRILLQIKSVCGVVGRDSMLVFDEGCIRSDLWMKVHEK